MSSYEGVVPELLMDMRTMAGPLSFGFSIGVPSEATTALLLVRYCLLVVTTVGAASSSAVHLVARFKECLVPETTIFDLLRSGWPFIRSTTSAVVVGAGGSTLSDYCFPTTSASSVTTAV
uniref:Uncharacterized protein n=1 Tax=Populus trichocarpa TaxID=3694 RepID=A0A2K1R8N3_POPTR